MYNIYFAAVMIIFTTIIIRLLKVHIKFILIFVRNFCNTRQRKCKKNYNIIYIISSIRFINIFLDILKNNIFEKKMRILMENVCIIYILREIEIIVQYLSRNSFSCHRSNEKKRKIWQLSSDKYVHNILYYFVILYID